MGFTGQNEVFAGHVPSQELSQLQCCIYFAFGFSLTV